MEIRIDSLLAGAERAVGVVVIIDVFRAFTTAAVALARGAAKIIIVSSVEEALALRSAGVGHFCMGEVRGRAAPGFDLGNSPFEASQVHFEGMTVIQRTSAGTQGNCGGEASHSALRWIVRHRDGDRACHAQACAEACHTGRDGKGGRIQNG
jgi:hypothetical protein